MHTNQLMLVTRIITFSFTNEKKPINTDCGKIQFSGAQKIKKSMEQLGSHWTDFHKIWYLST